MKKNKLVLLSAILALVGLSGCDERNEADITSDIAVTSVSLSQGYATLEVGETLQLTPTITYQDEKEYSCYTEWRTSNSKLATVTDAGLVTAVKPGSVSITFIAGFKSASCSITIPDHSEVAPIVPSDPSTPGGGGSSSEFTISLNASNINLSVEGSSYYQLQATTSAQASVSWSSSNDAVASVDQTGLVVAMDEGNAVITASANGVNATCSVSVLGKEEEDLPADEDMTVHIYFFIDYNNADEEDTTGKKLLSKFWWYPNQAISESGKIPANPTTAPIAAFPYFAGWSYYPIIDTKADLADFTDVNKYSSIVSDGREALFIYGIWTDVPGGMQL